MLLIKLKPVTPGTRGKVKIYNNLYKGSPVLSLCKKITNNSGRNNLGHITVRHKGGGLKKLYRFIDFSRLKDNIYAKVIRIEYDPNRNANLALLLYEDGEKKYIIEPHNLFIGNRVISGDNIPFDIGNTTYLKNIPYGTKVHCVELKPGKGGQFIRSAGCYAVIISKDKSYVYLSLKSGELRRFNEYCRATIGQVGNIEYNLLNLGKAGVNRLKGIRPTVRGVAMNPIDHPHGGGEGRTSGGRDPVTPWGVHTKGYKTVKRKNINIIKKH